MIQVWLCYDRDYRSRQRIVKQASLYLFSNIGTDHRIRFVYLPQMNGLAEGVQPDSIVCLCISIATKPTGMKSLMECCLCIVCLNKNLLITLCQVIMPIFHKAKPFFHLRLELAPYEISESFGSHDATKKTFVNMMTVFREILTAKDNCLTPNEAESRLWQETWREKGLFLCFFLLPDNFIFYCPIF